ncbi:MAG: GerMN domain-containing protein [Eubacteriales bacterium]|nr:GerMN domain-containing protein [Eubacteriales bacterium]
MKRTIGIFLAAVLAGLFVSGCSIETQEAQSSGGSQYYEYYVNKSETKLSREEYFPEKETWEFMVQDLTERMNGQTAKKDRVPLLPAEVKILSATLSGTVLNVSFGTAYHGVSRAREILLRSGVVRTYTQIPGITGVKFFVGGGELMDSREQPVGEMNNSSFVELWGNNQDAYRSDTFTLYFADSTGERLVPESRTVYYKRNLPKAQVVLAQLIKGPSVKDHYPTLPEGAEVLQVMTADRVCYVDFNQAFQDLALDLPSSTVIYSVVNSLLSSVPADKVQISVGGKDEVSFGRDETSLYNFYGWNEELISSGQPLF